MSPVHKDDDYGLSILTAFNPDCKTEKAIVQFFIFPEIRLSIPIYNKSVIIFNPKVLHCASNPTIPNTYIASAYSSHKTYHTCVAKYLSDVTAMSFK
jgi:hypothetical protein